MIKKYFSLPNSESYWVYVFNIFLDQVSYQFDIVVISGDFNMPHIPWNNSGDNNNNGGVFL